MASKRKKASKAKKVKKGSKAKKYSRKKVEKRSEKRTRKKTKKSTKKQARKTAKKSTRREVEKKEEQAEVSVRVQLDKKVIEDTQKKLDLMYKEIGKAIIGQEETVFSTVTGLICDGHILLEGVPGLAKSLLVETLGRVVKGTTFRRIQFVPDMLPADILGVNAYNPKTGGFYIVKGPIFANFILADEINRAPPKTQAALMEVMQEKKVNIHKEMFPLDRPFLVLATQNPLEQYGTYPLPEAIVDRFFMKIILDYPKPKEEMEIINRNTIVNRDELTVIEPVVTKADILKFQHLVRQVYIAPEIKQYIIDIVNTTRGRSEYKIPELKYIKYGGSPRASIYLGLAGRAVALMNGRDFVIPEDIKRAAHDVLRHRILLNYEGKAAGIQTDEIITKILEIIEVV